MGAVQVTVQLLAFDLPYPFCLHVEGRYLGCRGDQEVVVAEKIQQHENIVVLAIGTDGSDGPSDAAGALVDARTIQRGLQLSLDSKQALLDANAGYYLAETGDLIDTGPTGSNVMDLVIAVKLAPR